MLNQIQLFFDQYLALPEPTAIAEEKLHLACAALFIEMMHIDDSVHTEEHEMILKRIRNIFSLSTEEATRLINLAEGHRQNATDYHAFTSLINKNYTQNQKKTLIKTLWEIAYADGQLDKYEEQMVRKIADLLHIPHLDFIRTKIQVNGG